VTQSLQSRDLLGTPCRDIRRVHVARPQPPGRISHVFDEVPNRRSVCGGRRRGSPGPRPECALLSVSGVAYTQYLYLLSDTLNHGNNFDVTRAYLNFNGRFDAVTTRSPPTSIGLRRVAGLSPQVRLRRIHAEEQQAHVQARPDPTPRGSTGKRTCGTNRMQGQMALERGDQIAPLSYMSSSDSARDRRQVGT